MSETQPTNPDPESTEGNEPTLEPPPAKKNRFEASYTFFLERRNFLKPWNPFEF